MANYSDIRGYRVKYLSSDPTLNTSTEGQVWYNSTSGTLKSLVQIKAWSAGSNANVPRQDGMGDGTPTAAVYFGGDNAPGPTGSQTATEEYNGYAWASGGNMSTGRNSAAGFGTQTAAVCAAGNGATGFQTVTEEYDGATWTSGGAFPTASRFLGASGVLTAGLAANANESGVTRTDSSDAYDGTSWAATNPTLNPAQGFNSLSGTQTASLITHRFTASTDDYVTTESWDGTSWTSVANSNNSVYGSGAFGTQDHQISFGGTSGPAAQNYTEEWDGTTWFNSPATLSTADYYNARAGKTGTGGLKFGGRDGGTPGPVATEEYNSNINVALPGAWASANNMNVNRFNWRTDIGIQTATLVAGGGDPSNTYLSSSEEYDGTSWTAGGNLPQTLGDLGGGGTQTAAFASGGNNPGDTRQSQTSNYDGTSWTVSGSMPFASGQGTGWGTQTAGAHVGGTNGTSFATTTAEYNGSTWTVGGAYPVAIGYNFAVGTQTAGLSAMGLENGTTQNTNAVEYNGSSWTAGGSNNTQRFASGAFGVQTSAIYAGGPPGAASQGSAVEQYNGTGWTSVSSTSSSAGYRMGGGANVGSGIIMGGNGSPSGTGPNATTNVAEEWTSPSGVVATASTLTTS